MRSEWMILRKDASNALTRLVALAGESNGRGLNSKCDETMTEVREQAVISSLQRNIRRSFRSSNRPLTTDSPRSLTPFSK